VDLGEDGGEEEVVVATVEKKMEMKELLEDRETIPMRRRRREEEDHREEGGARRGSPAARITAVETASIPSSREHLPRMITDGATGWREGSPPSARSAPA